MNPYAWQYRKLGGWLMFINVMSIIGIASGGAGILSYISLFAMFGAMRGIEPAMSAMFDAFQVFMGVMFIVMLVQLALNICVVVFLNRRRLQPLKIAYLAEYALTVLMYIAGIILFAVVPFSNLYAVLFRDMPGDAYYELQSSGFLAMMDSFNIVYIMIYAVAAAVAIGLGVAWWFYFKKSQRVKVYFDPNFPEPPPYYMWDARAAWQPPVYNAPAYGYAPPAPGQNQYPGPSSAQPHYLQQGQPYGGQPQTPAPGDHQNGQGQNQ